MVHYRIQFADWSGGWLDDGDMTFLTLHDAMSHGKACFAQNEWRVCRGEGRNVVYVHDPAAVIERAAGVERDRFDNRTRWMEDREERARVSALEASPLWVRHMNPFEPNAARAARSQVHLSGVAQRQVARDYEAERRARLLGFNFVGDRPPVLDLPRRKKRRRRKEEHVNWLKEGF